MDTRTHKVALGLMSGTSVDGVDAAFLETDGLTITRLGPSLSLPYTQDERDTLMRATEAALRWQFKGPQPNSFRAVETIIHESHVRAVNKLCAEHANWADDLQLIGFHGQTVLHHPARHDSPGKTMQLGEGQALADALGVPVYYDFRSADVAAGGQGAPLAPIYHDALVAYSKIDKPVAVLNIGGVGNVTLIASDAEISATDTGPGNGPLDNWIEKCGAGVFDESGRYSDAGTVDTAKVEAWLSRAFFSRPIPRSADRYDFDVLGDLCGMTLEDGAATLAAFTTLAVKHALKDMNPYPQSLIVCGGGRHNRTMMAMLEADLGVTIKTAEEAGWNSDAIEAQAFAYLAVRSEQGLPLSFPGTTGVAAPLTGGRVAQPR